MIENSLFCQNTDDPAEAGQKRHMVLVVDDDRDSAETMIHMLELMGHDARAASSGFDAIETAKTIQPQMILLDLNMPGMDGYQICATLRREPGLHKTVIVAQTGYGDEEHLQKSRIAGFDDYLVKPVSVETLQEKLNRL